VEIRDILTPEAVATRHRATSKKQLLQEVAARAAAAYGLAARAVFDALLERERLGGTGLGRGVAAPHARLSGVETILGVFVTLEKPVDFDAADGQPVDVVFALLAPELAGADHLRALARVSRVLRNSDACAKLRSCETGSAVLAVLSEPAAHRAA